MDEKEGSSGCGQKNGNCNNSIDALLDTSKAERATWLIKCPHLIDTSLQSPPDDSDPSRPVAKVVLSVDPLRSKDDNSATELTMELAGTESGKFPTYSMDMSDNKDSLPMLVFSESSQGKCCVEGKILNKLGTRPHDKDIDNYGKLFRERLNKYKAKSRQIQVIGNDDAVVHMRPMPGMLGHDNKKMAAKRHGRARSEMQEIMFKLFERQPNWTLRQLIQETDQPKQLLRDVLQDLCVYNDQGSNIGSYELKPEYKETNYDEPSPK